MSVTSSTAACRSQSSSFRFYSIDDSESEFDSRQPDNDTREVAAILKREENADSDPRVQATQGMSLLKRIGLEKNRFGGNSRLLPIHEAPNSKSGSFGGLGSNLSLTASLIAVTSNTWEGADSYALVPSNSAMNGTSTDNTSLDHKRGKSFDNHTRTMKEVDMEDGHTDPEESDLPFFGTESTSVSSGTTEKTTSIITEGSYLSVLRAGAASSFFGATEKTTPTEPPESHISIVSAESASIFSGTTKKTTQSENERRDRTAIRDFYSPLSVSSGITENLGSRTSAVNSLKSVPKTPLEVQRPKIHLVSKSSLLSRVGDDETAQEETHIMPNKDDNDEEKGAQKNKQATKATNWKGFFKLRRARARSKSTVMNTSTEVTRSEHPPQSQKTVNANEAINNRSVNALEDGDGKKPKSLITQSFRRQGSSGSLVENSAVAIEDGDGTKSQSAKILTCRRPTSSFESLVEKDSVSTVIANNIKREENEGIEVEASPPKTESPRARSTLSVVGALARLKSQSGSAVKKSRKEVALASLDDHLNAVERSTAPPEKNTAPPFEGSGNGSDISEDSPFTLFTVTSSEIRAFRHDDSIGDNICVDNFLACQPAAYSVLFQEDLPRKPKKSCFDICSRCLSEMFLDNIILWEDDVSMLTRDDTLGTSGTGTLSDTQDAGTLKSEDVSIVDKADVDDSKTDDADTWNTGKNATLSSVECKGMDTLKSDDAHIYAVAEDPREEVKVRKERFLNFCKALCQDLKDTNPLMHARVKAVIQDCMDKKKERVPGFDFESSMRTQLLDSVGESNWRRVERDLHKSMHDITTISV